MTRAGSRILAMALVAALVASLGGAVRAADKGKKNVGWVKPDYASYNVTRIGLGGLTSVERDATNEHLFRDELENGVATGTEYKFQSLSAFQDAARTAGVTGAVTALANAAFAGSPPDSAAVAALRGKVGVDAILFVHVTRMERNLIDADTRGQASTDVGAEFVLVAVRDGAVLWRGNFAERGLGPYNEPNVADVGQRDPTGNAQARPGALDPPQYPDVLLRFVRKVTASLPPPGSGTTAAAPAPSPAH